MNKTYIKKQLAIAVICLFIGLTFAPSINANISKSSLETVEFTTEICGLNGGKQMVKLTQAEAEEVEALFKSIRAQLNETETGEESEEIFKEAVVELDKYGLLGSLSIKQAQRLATGRCKNPWLMRLLDKIGARWKENSSIEPTNLFCLVFANINKGDCFNFELNIFAPILFIYGAIGIYFKLLDILVSLIWFYSQLKPFRVINSVAMLNLGVKFSVYSLGLLGFKNTIVNCGCLYNILGFTGIIIKSNCDCQDIFPICDTFYQ